MYNKREIRKTLYALKKQYSRSITWYHLISDSINLETGKMANNYVSRVISKAILLPIESNRVQFAGGQFKMGGLTDSNIRHVILDEKDMPTFDLNDVIVIDNKRWNLKQAPERYEESTALLITICNITGSERDLIFQASVSSSLEVSDAQINS